MTGRRAAAAGRLGWAVEVGLIFKILLDFFLPLPGKGLTRSFLGDDLPLMVGIDNVSLSGKEPDSSRGGLRNENDIAKTISCSNQ